MKFEQVIQGQKLPKASCCGRAARQGQWVAIHRSKKPGVYVDLTVVLHASCLKAKLEDVPEDDVVPTDPQAAFRAERRRLTAAVAA